MPRTVAIIQARMQSTRLPGKVLREIAGKPMLEHVVERTAAASLVDDVMVATSQAAADQALLEYCQQMGWTAIAGDEHDVLGRYVLAARESAAEQIVRITSDCPLIDPELIDQVIARGQLSRADYCCNFFPFRHFPRGLDCEFLTVKTLERVHQLAVESRHREHVTLFLYDQQLTRTNARPDFTLDGIVADQDWSQHRWTVDTGEDLQLIRTIYETFGETVFGWRDVLSLVQSRPELQTINQGTVQKVA